MQWHDASKLLAGLLTLCLLPAISLQADEPLPAGPDAYLFKDFQDAKLKFRLLAVEDYKRFTKDEGQTKQAGIDFLHEYARRAANKADQISKEEIAVMAEDVEAAGSTDPLLMLYAARTAMLVNQRDKAMAMMKHLSGVWGQYEYPKLYTQLCEQWQYTFSNQMVKWLSERTVPAPLIESIVHNFQEPVAEEVHLRCKWDMLDYVLKEFSIKDFGRLEQACAAAEGVEPWLYHMLAGTLALRRAADVYPANYKQANAGHKKRYAAAMRPAREHFTAAWKLHPRLPEPAAEMILVATAGADEHSPRYWFDQAVAVQLDYSIAYGHLFESLRPHWGGSHSKIWKFALECRDTARFDTVLPAKMIQGISLIDRDLLGTGEAWRKKGVYEACLRLFAGYEKYNLEKNDAAAIKSLAYYRSVHAAVAVRAERYDHARKIFEKVGEDLSESGYGAVGLRGQLYRDRARAYALASPSGPELLELAKKAEAKSFSDLAAVEQGMEKVQSLLQANQDKIAISYYVQLYNLLKSEKEQFNNAWRDLLFDPANPNWTKQSYDDEWGKNYIVENPHSLIMAHTTPGRRLSLTYDGIFPAPYMLEVDIETINEGPAKGTKTAPCILIRKKGQLRDIGGTFRNRYRVFYIDTVRGRVGTWDYPGKAMGRNIPLNKKTNRLRVKVWPGYFDYYVNGTRLMRLALKDFEPEPDFTISVIAHDRHRSKIRFSNFRAKPIHYGPPPEDDASTEELIKYYTKVLEDDPEEGHAYKRRGVALYDQKKYEAAMKDFEAAMKYGVGADQCYVENKIARIFEKQEKYEETLAYLRKTVEHSMTNQNYIYRMNLSWFLATCPEKKYRDGAEALKLALQAKKDAVKHYSFHDDALAAAYAETGDFAEAVTWVQKAVSGYKEADEKKEAKERLELYQQGKPFRDIPEESLEDEQ